MTTEEKRYGEELPCGCIKISKKEREEIMNIIKEIDEEK